MTVARACIQAIGCAVPTQDIHAAFIGWAENQLGDTRDRAIFARMAGRSGIDHRWSVLPVSQAGGSPVDAGGFYGGEMPPTSQRMQIYAQEAPELAMAAIDRLLAQVPLDGVTHLVVASCTGFVAPGIDQIIAERLGMVGVERTLIGFMGCYAAVAALRTARHIVRSEPDARVLVVTVELSSLHFQLDTQVERLLAMLQFGDGAAAALVSAGDAGIAIDRSFSIAVPDTADLIRWDVGDSGFIMHLSGAVPGHIQAALGNADVRRQILGGDDVSAIDSWAVHAGGRSILDAVEHGLMLGDTALALALSRSVLTRFGNMSSATLMFILRDMLAERGTGQGVALAFGPGLAAEGFRFERLG